MFTKIRLWSQGFVTPFEEALKEAFRVTLFSVPGQLILFLEDKELAYKAVIVNLILIFLRALDRYLYEKSKSKGLAPGEVRGGLSPI
jgi:hypothetical protein